MVSRRKIAQDGLAAGVFCFLEIEKENEVIGWSAQRDSNT